MGVSYNLGDVDYVVGKYITKQNIGRAMQAGVIDPVVGTIAGMNIDRIVAAQAAAQQNAMPTIAEQVFAPPAPPAPMGGMGPPPGAPPMGAPPTGGMGMPPAPPMGGMPPGAPPMGMADGGLAALPIPDSMFDEPDNGGYAGGGIVSFAAGTPGTVKADENLFGYSSDPMALVEEHRRLYKPKTEASERAKKLYNEVLSEEGQKKRLNEDRYLALAKGFFTMAGTPGSLFQSASAGAKAALPDLQESSKELRAEQREAIKQLALDEGASNAEARREADLYMQGKGKYAELAQTEKNREFEREKFAGQQELGYAQIAAQERASRAAAAARDNLDFTEKNAEIIYQQLKARNDRLPYYKGTAKFFDKNQYQRTDQALRAEAYERAAKMRYFSPADNPLTTTRAGLLASMAGPDGGGEQGVTTVAWPSPKS